jgi:hypothetical protein
MEKNSAFMEMLGLHDTAGAMDPGWTFVPHLAYMACVGLLHFLISGTPTRGGAASWRSQVTPSSGSVEALRPSHPLSLP